MVKKNITENFSASLVLPRIISKMLGFEEAIDIVDFIKQSAGDDMDVGSGLSNFMDEILQRFDQASIPDSLKFITKEKLIEYDGNIREIFDQINQRREFKLKTFQYVALLFTEIYLDMYFSMEKEQLIKFLNIALNHIKKFAKISEYTEDDIGKVCFWMATGSGKTLIMHANYYQFLRYVKKYRTGKPNNVILITPNEDMSKQHMKEMKISGIRAIPYTDYKSMIDAVKVIDVYKFKKSSGKKNVKTIDPRSFGTGNLIFVDEGHKGQSGEIWLEHRKIVSEEGFVFEYSATFQDFKSQKKRNRKSTNDLITDYQKTIIFDYSYKFFHQDGYGKDYMIVNFSGIGESEYKWWAMVSALLAFYEQKKFYYDHENDMKIIQAEDPLWILVGSRVVEDSSSAEETLRSHILQFIRFLSSIKTTKRDKFIEDVRKILTDDVPIIDKETNEMFSTNKFQYVKKLYESKGIDYIIEDMFNLVFHSSISRSKLELVSIKKADGEIGIRFKDSPQNVYFGLIYVGKGNDKKLLDFIKEKGLENIEADYDKGDKLTNSLFSSLSKKLNKPINILIGARKFIEGWNNYRVSTMLLIEFGKNKGISAIQLFGRGVRLHGYKNSMKRSSVIHPPISSRSMEFVKTIETLNVFGINAKYMDEFRKELEEDIEFYVERIVYVKKDPLDLIKSSNLKIIKQKDDIEETFKSNKIVRLSPFPITIDLRPFIKQIGISEKQRANTPKEIITSDLLTDEMLGLVDWEYILQDIRKVKKYREMRNLSVTNKADLIDLIKEMRNDGNILRIIGDVDEFNIRTLKEKTKLITELIANIFRKLISYSWKVEFKQFYSSETELIDMDERFIPEKYTVRIPISDRGLKPKISTRFTEEIIKRTNELDYDDIKDLINNGISIKFERHLYEPLFVASGDKSYELYPPGLNPLEVKFVKELRKFVEASKNIKKKIVLFRNNERIGVGYFRETEKYYPDFILWVVDDSGQKIAFVDPKGLVHVDEQKVSFHIDIKEIEKEIRKKYKENIELYAYIITSTDRYKIGDEKIRKNPSKYGIFFEEGFIQNIMKDMGVI